MDNLALNLLPIDGPKPSKKKVVAPTVPVAADTLITPKGNIVTRAQFEMSAKNGLAFNDMKSMGDWIDGWQRNTLDTKLALPLNAPVKKKDYYEGYSTPGSGSMRYHQ